MDNFYKQAINESPVGFAYHKILLNENGEPCDYEFLEVNDAFETFTGLNRIDIIGKRITEVLPGINDSEFDWIKIYGEIASKGGTIEFDNFSEPLQRSYKVKAYAPHPNHFITQFTESSSEIIWANDLNIVFEMSEELLQLEKGGSIDYQMIADSLKKVSCAKFVVFNLYEDDGTHYSTVAVSGDKSPIKKAESILGFKIKETRWEPNPAILERTKAFAVSKFTSLRALAADAIPKPILYSIEKIFKLGEVVYIRITKGDLLLGDFQLFMNKGDVLEKTRIIEIMAKQVGNAITRSRAERDLLELEQCYRGLFEYSDTGIAFYNPQGIIISYNNRAASNMGGKPEDFVGKSLFDLFPKADALHYMNRIEQALTIDGQVEYTDYIELSTGNSWFHSKYNRIKASNGSVVGVQIISQDITEQRRSEKALIQSHDLMQYIIEHNRSAVAILDKDLKFLYVSKRYLDDCMIKEDNIIGKYNYEVFPDFPQNWSDAHQKALMGEISSGKKDAYLRNDGSLDWICWECLPWYEADGTIGGIVVYTEIITDRVNLLKDLNDKEYNLRLAQEITHVGSFQYDAVSKKLTCSDECLSIFGITREEFSGEKNMLLELLHPDDSQQLSEITLDAIHKKEVMRSELRIIRRDGEERIIDNRIQPVFDENGICVSISGTIQDITERKKNEENLIYINNHDFLTDLYNRRFFEEEIKRLDVQENLPLSIIMADTNGLKIINDSFGHDMGDELLKKAAGVLKKACRKEDLIVRYGGDEFIIVLPNTNSAEALRIASLMKELALEEKVANIELSISYGYDTKYTAHESIMEILANAENHMYSHKLSERSSMRSKTIELIMNTLFEKSRRESQHSMRVSKLCEAIAVKMKLEDQRIDKIRVAGLVHDIGKIGIDEKILNKNGMLDTDERKEIEKHSEAGWRILSSSSEFVKLAQCVLHHHERWDGNGYPNNLQNENIPIESRIIAVADAYDAMTSERSYKTAMSHEEAIKEITRCAGTQFDPAIVDAFINLQTPK